MIEIRQATHRDIAILASLIREYWTFEEIPGFNVNGVTEQLDRLLTTASLGYGCLAWLDDEPVGYLLVVYVFSLEHLGLTAEIDELFVREQHREKHAGAALLQHALLQATEMGCTNISLQLSGTNATARRLYKHHGFVERAGYEMLEKDLTKVR